MNRRVVVTGIGALTPIGNNKTQFWDALLAGVSGANLITRFDTTHFKTKFACEVKDFDPSLFIDRKDMRKMDLCGQYAFVAAQEAINDAKLIESDVNKERVGVILGTGIGGYTSLHESSETFLKNGGTPRFSPFFIPRILGDSIASNIALAYEYTGPSFVTTSACASAANAIIDAYYNIILGKSEVIISGGAEACIEGPPIGGFNAMNALSVNNDEYLSASRPFDASRDGFVMGEGAGIIVLEEYEHAVKRGAHIYAEISGVALTTDVHHFTAPHPDGDAAYKSMQLAIEDAMISPADVQHINTHGTATPLGDLSECIAIDNLFGSIGNRVLVNSTKSMTGHLLGAAAAVEAIVTVLAIKHQVVPPTINVKNIDPEMPDINFVLDQKLPTQLNHAISNSFGFGGHNSSIVFSKIK